MFLQVSSSILFILIIEKIFTKTILNGIKNFNIEKLIEYLKRKDLELRKTYFKILQKEKIANFDFFKLTKEKLYSISFMLSSAIRLMKFIESFS